MSVRPTMEIATRFIRETLDQWGWPSLFGYCLPPSVWNFAIRESRKIVRLTVSGVFRPDPPNIFVLFGRIVGRYFTDDKEIQVPPALCSAVPSVSESRGQLFIDGDY